jgi:hypothetical protein
MNVPQSLGALNNQQGLSQRFGPYAILLNDKLQAEE